MRDCSQEATAIVIAMIVRAQGVTEDRLEIRSLRLWATPVWELESRFHEDREAQSTVDTALDSHRPMKWRGASEWTKGVSRRASALLIFFRESDLSGSQNALLFVSGFFSPCLRGYSVVRPPPVPRTSGF